MMSSLRFTRALLVVAQISDSMAVQQDHLFEFAPTGAIRHR